MRVIFGREPGKLLLQNPSFSFPSQAVRCFEAKVHQASRVSVYFFTSSAFFIVIPLSVGSGKSRKTKMRATFDVWRIQAVRLSVCLHSYCANSHTSFRFSGCCRRCLSLSETSFVCVNGVGWSFIYFCVVLCITMTEC